MSISPNKVPDSETLIKIQKDVEEGKYEDAVLCIFYLDNQRAKPFNEVLTIINEYLPSSKPEFTGDDLEISINVLIQRGLLQERK